MFHPDVDIRPTRNEFNQTHPNLDKLLMDLYYKLEKEHWSSGITSYQSAYFFNFPVEIEKQKNNTVIMRSNTKDNRYIFNDHFDLYCRIVCGGNLLQVKNNRANWYPRIVLNNPLSQQPSQGNNSIVPVNSELAYNYQQQYGNNFQYNSYPQPTFDVYDYIHGEPKECELNLQDCFPSSHILHRMASYIHKERPLPLSTLILVGLGVASGMTAKKWNCAYLKKGTSPICLYIVAEYGAGKGKTYALDIFKQPLKDIVSKTSKKFRKLINDKENEKLQHAINGIDEKEKGATQKYKAKIKMIDEEIKSLEDREKSINSFNPITQTTPEALEESLNKTNGFFIVASDEKSLIDTLIIPKNKKSNVVLLNGRDAGYYQSIRVGRKGYVGTLTGSFIVFAQKGPIKSIINASDNTGLFERFLIACEPEVDKRPYSELQSDDEIQADVNHYENLYNVYASKFAFLEELILNPLRYDELESLKISKNSWDDIYKFQNDYKNKIIHNHLSSDMLETMIEKADKQVMSIASNLYLLDLADNNAPLENNNQIPDYYVLYAIHMVKEIINGTVEYFKLNGHIIKKEYIREFLECFYCKKRQDYFPMTHHQLIHKFEQRKVLGGIEGARKMTEKILAIMLNEKAVLSDGNGNYMRNPKTLRTQKQILT
jgi:hypothetical protein